MVVHLFDRLSQLSTLTLALRARGQRRGRDDPQVHVGRRGGSGGRESGTQVRLGCREVDSRRLHWTVSRREWGEGDARYSLLVVKR